MFKLYKFGGIHPQNVHTLKKTNQWVHILLPGDTSEKQGCNQGSNAILGSSAEKSVAAKGDLAASEAVL